MLARGKLLNSDMTWLNDSDPPLNIFDTIARIRFEMQIFFSTK